MQAVRTLSTGLLAALLVVGLGACSDDKSATSTVPGSTPAPAPEELRASDADVAAGLGDIKSFARDIATYLTSDHQRAVDAQQKIEPTWARIEGTIKANDQATYLTFEDQFAVLGNAVTSSDKTKADTAAALVEKAADEYLAKHPGSGPASPAPSGTSTPTATPGSTDSASPSPTAS
ncbi:MAG TPA: hypothetical protein VMZ00_12915 [Sporichthya sp.]|nr:hypothetical protein [Sporichthya sp.]